MKSLYLILILSLLLVSCKSDAKKEVDIIGPEAEASMELEEVDSIEVEILPVSHASAVIEFDDTSIYLDPTGGAKAFEGMDSADLVLLTDIHGDHLNPETLEALNFDEDIRIIAPQAVKDELPNSLQLQVQVMANGDKIEEEDISIEAIPMYNLREEALQFHEKGRGNGYVLEKNGTRVYIAGDTEDIPEMRDLKDIDIALIPMNLPYTMTVESAADAVLEFAPKQVYPYHFRGTEGMADVDKFRQLVNEGNPEIEVVLLEWYPDAQEQESR